MIKVFAASTLLLCSIALAQTCRPYPLSEREASELLLSMDVTEALAGLGTLKPTSYVPGGSSRPRTDRFYFFVIYAGGGDGTDSGLLGYYVVDKLTGRVIDDILSKDVTGNSFGGAQEKLRSRHCITAKMVKDAEALDPYG